MKPTSCPRIFEVEAVRDGRLGDAEKLAFERHRASCSACSDEAGALDALAEAIRTIGSDTDELHARRERTRLLAAFDRSLVAEPKRSTGRSLVWAGAVMAVATGAFLFWRARPAPPVVERLVASTEIRAEGPAVWSKRTDGQREHVTLERGALRIHVDHSRGEGQLLVVLPDGELEDTGTTFTVAAEDGHTARVDVEEGSVVLRLHGRLPVTLHAGESWAASASASASAPETATAAATAPASATATATAPAPAPASATAAATAPAFAFASATAAATGGAPNPSDEFRAAMAALDRREDREAVTKFGAFLAKHPRDPRAEDAAYLRVVALQRLGEVDDTKRAAQEYLRRFPSGFRRSEVEGLTR